MAKASFSDDVMRVIRAAAPTVGGILGAAIPIPGVGSAIGAGVAGMAVDALAKALGTDPTPEAVNARIEQDLAVVSSGGSAALLREADLHAKLNRAEDVALAKISADMEIAKQGLDNEDRSNARATFAEAKDYTQKSIAFIVVFGFLACMGYAMWQGLPDGNRDLLLILAGTLTAAFIAVMNYYFGSSQGSKRAGDTLRGLAKR